MVVSFHDDSPKVMAFGIERRSIYVIGVAAFSRPILALLGVLISISCRLLLTMLMLIMISILL